MAMKNATSIITLRITPELKDKLQGVADKEGKSLNALLTEVVEEKIEKERSKNMIRYELKSYSVELKFDSIIPGELIPGFALRYEGLYDPDQLGTFDTEEEAQDALKEYQGGYKKNGSKITVTDYYFETVEVDQDGEFLNVLNFTFAEWDPKNDLSRYKEAIKTLEELAEENEVPTLAILQATDCDYYDVDGFDDAADKIEEATDFYDVDEDKLESIKANKCYDFSPIEIEGQIRIARSYGANGFNMGDKAFKIYTFDSIEQAQKACDAINLGLIDYTANYWIKFNRFVYNNQITLEQLETARLLNALDTREW